MSEAIGSGLTDHHAGPRAFRRPKVGLALLIGQSSLVRDLPAIGTGRDRQGFGQSFELPSLIINYSASSTTPPINNFPPPQEYPLLSCSRLRIYASDLATEQPALLFRRLRIGTRTAASKTPSGYGTITDFNRCITVETAEKGLSQVTRIS
jgi:hypothetical protein